MISARNQLSQVIIKARISSYAKEINQEQDPLNQAMRMLWRAYRYAVDTKLSRWHFAVEIEEFRGTGISTSELRWLVVSGLALHAKEISDLDGESRRFVPLSKISFPPKTTLVLSDYGVKILEELPHSTVVPQHSITRQKHQSMNNGKAELQVLPLSAQDVPLWNTSQRQLSFQGKLVKLFMSPACNQEAILSSFQEEGWVPRIDDPLPPAAEIDCKRRLCDAIKQLNRHHKHQVLRFRGDGSGKGILWDRLQ